MVSALEALAQHRLLDRLIRGRTWIGIVAFALIGIVTLQLGLLKLNGGIGRALEHEAVLQRQNATLAIENSELAAGTRVESRAAALGMGFAASGALHFLSSSTHGDIAKAANALSTPIHATASSEGSQSTGPAGETSGETESSAGESSEAPASTESSAQSETSSTASGEAASGESSASAEAAAPESSAAASGEPEPTGSAAAQTGAGGGVQATSSGE
jgi:hypothetical protein